MGVFSILEEESIVPKATDETFRQKLYERHEKNSPAFAKPRVGGKAKGNAHFEVLHYAGVVSSIHESSLFGEGYFLGDFFVWKYFFLYKKQLNACELSLFEIT